MTLFGKHVDRQGWSFAIVRSFCRRPALFGILPFEQCTGLIRSAQPGFFSRTTLELPCTHYKCYCLLQVKLERFGKRLGQSPTISD